MNLDTTTDVYDALALIEEVSVTHKDLAFKCVQRAKVLKDLDLEFESRFHYLRQLVFLSEYEEATAMFPWFLNICDKHPDRFDYFKVLWSFKWIIGAINYYHKITMGQLNNLFQEFEKRFKAYGSGEKVLHYYRMRFYSETGRIQESLEEYEEYKRNNDTGDLDDCLACQPNNCMEVFLVAQQYAKVLELTKYILDKKLKCHNVPNTSYPTAVHAAIMLNQWELAENYFQLALKKTKLKESNLFHFHNLLLYCACKKNELKGRTIIEKQLPFALTTTSNYKLFFFYTAVFIFLKALGHEQIKLAIKIESQNFVPPIKANIYSVSQLTEWFRSQSLENARLLDARNGNNFFGQHFEYLAARMLKKISQGSGS